MLNKEDKIKIVLENSRWYPSRNIDIEHNDLYKLLPKKIKTFYCEFGGLAISNKDFCQIHYEIDISITWLNNPQLLYEYKKYLNLLKEPINTSIDDDQYYFSKILGKSLLIVANSIQDDGDHLILDEDGNFYIHTIVPELMWISNNPIDAFKNLLFGGDSYVLNEEKLQWISPKGTTQKYNPPINNELLKNPWWY